MRRSMMTAGWSNSVTTAVTLNSAYYYTGFTYSFYGAGEVPGYYQMIGSMAPANAPFKEYTIYSFIELDYDGTANNSYIYFILQIPDGVLNPVQSTVKTVKCNGVTLETSTASFSIINGNLSGKPEAQWSWADQPHFLLDGGVYTLEVIG